MFWYNIETMCQYYIDKVIQGKKHYFRYIVERFEKKIFYYFLRLTVNYEESMDLTQNTFIKCYKYLKKYDKSQSFSTWLYKIAHNQFIDWHNKNKKKAMSLNQLEEEYFMQFKNSVNIEKEINEKELLKITKKAILLLPPIYKEVMILKIIEEKTQSEISEIMGISKSTVKIRIYRARLMLKEALSKIYEKN